MDFKDTHVKNIFFRSVFINFLTVIVPSMAAILLLSYIFFRYYPIKENHQLLFFSFMVILLYTIIVAYTFYRKFYNSVNRLLHEIDEIPEESIHNIIKGDDKPKIKAAQPFLSLMISRLKETLEIQKEYAEKLELSNKKLQQANEIIEKSSIIIVDWSIEPGVPANFVTKNISNFGYNEEDFLTGRVDFWDFVYKEDVEKTQRTIWGARKENIDEYKHNYRAICKNQDIRWVEEWTILERDDKGTLVSEKSIIRDITEQVETASKLQQSEIRFRELFENASALIYTYDMKGQFTSANRACTDITGYSKDELLNMHITDLYVDFMGVIPHDFSNLEYLENNVGKAIEVEITCKDRSKVIIESKSCLLYKDGIPVEIQTVAQDITDRKQAEEKIYNLTFNDKLTGLYNRLYFDDALRELDEKKAYPYSIIIGDMNGLKLTNDAFGHQEGDSLLKITAEILQRACPDNGITARLSGDEFSILLPDTANHEAMVICSRIRKLCKEVTNNRVQPSIALGYATKETVLQSVGEILREAEDTMYRNKLNESKSIRSAIISSLQATLEEKTLETLDHAERIKCLALQLGASIGLPDNLLDELAIAASMHDIGKVGIPDSILAKPGPLTPEEWDIMKKHPEIGYHIILSSPNMAPISEYILSHHERWDGNGYPQGLKGAEIPIISRIISVVDAYDVMLNDRPYKKALCTEDAINEIQRCSGSQFDPQMVKTFVSLVRSDTFQSS